MTNHLIPLHQLIRSPLNARRTGNNEGIDELKASIFAHGLMQNLVVLPSGEDFYEVVAGGRRLTALVSLQAEGKLPADHSVPCQVVSHDKALELSIAENKVRHAMHPADEFEAFNQLIAQGQTEEAVATRFGVTLKHVQQRLKLGRVAPELMAAYRAGDLNLDCLMAFTVTDDHAKQMSVYQSLKGWQTDDDSHIRRCLTETAVESDDKLAKFVGVEAYVAAGGTVRSDLFTDEVYFEDAALLQKLAASKLDAAALSLEEEGWGWVEVSMQRDYSFAYSFGSIQPHAVNAPAELLEQKKQAEKELERIREQMRADDDEESDELWEQESEAVERIEEIDEKLEAYAAFDPEEMKSAGCYVALCRDGTLHVEKGLVKKADLKNQNSTGDTAASTGKPKEKPLYSQSLKADLETHRLQVAKLVIARSPEIAFDLLVFTVALRQFSRPIFDGPEVNFTKNFGTTSVNRNQTPASEALATTKEGLSLDWLKAKGEAAQYDQFRQLAQDEKLALLAYCTAESLKPKLAGGESAYEEALALTGGDLALIWRPTKDNYFSRVDKDQLLKIGGEVFGEKWVKSRSKWKKSELANRLDEDFANPDGVIDRYKRIAAEIYPQEVITRLKSWLPEGMAFKAPKAEEQPAKKAAKRSKKAA